MHWRLCLWDCASNQLLMQHDLNARFQAAQAVPIQLVLGNRNKLGSLWSGSIRPLVQYSNTDMEFVQNFTPPDFRAKNFTPSISPNFNSFSKKKHKKMSENGEIYTAGKNFTLPPALTAWTNSTSGTKPEQILQVFFQTGLYCTCQIRIGGSISVRQTGHSSSLNWKFMNNNSPKC